MEFVADDPVNDDDDDDDVFLDSFEVKDCKIKKNLNVKWKKKFIKNVIIVLIELW